LDRLGYIGSRLGHYDNCGSLVHSQVPRLPRTVVAVLARHENAAGDRGPQRFQVTADDSV